MHHLLRELTIAIYLLAGLDARGDTGGAIIDRRSLLKTLAAVGFASRPCCGSILLLPSPSSQLALKKPAGPSANPSTVAGVRIVNSKIAKAATDLCRAVSAPFLFNHAMRTFLYGSLVGRASGKSFDEEILFLACILHDLGLTERFASDLPFEIQGAEAAKQFLEGQAYAREKIEIVWDGIAMHCLSIGGYKRPEIALVGEGAGADVLGPDPAQINRTQTAEIMSVFPRLGFKNAFLKTCADVVQGHPKGAGRTFMRDIGERYVPSFHPRNFCDLVVQAPFDE